VPSVFDVIYMLTEGQIRFLGDPTAQFTEALDLAFDGSAIFGGPRSKRYAMEIENGTVKALHVEPDNTGLDGQSSWSGLLSFAN
jgi:peroxiredoxin